MKKVLSVILALALIFSAVPLSGISEHLQGLDFGFLAVKSSAASTSDLSFSLCSDGTSYRVSDCNESASGELTIPSTYNGKPVTSIGEDAFYYCSSLTSVTIPDSVTSIGEKAFYNCSRLTSVTIPDSVTSIGYEAFWGCSSLTSVTIPDSVTSIGDCAFEDCSSLTSVTIPDSVKSIGVGAFGNCSRLTSINVAADNNYYSSQDGVLFNKDKTELICCPEAKTGAYTIPSSVTSIGYGAFGGCSSLTSINVTADNKYYSSQDGVLFNKNKTELIRCPGAKTGAYTIPSSVTSIADGAFFGCSGLTSVTIPDSVTSIGVGAFYGCSALTSLTIPGSVTSIGDSAFVGCSGLTSLTIPGSVTSIADGAFSGCSGLTSVTIGNGVTSIGDFAFYFCQALKAVTIPDSVTSIGEHAFFVCSEAMVIYSAPNAYARTYAEWNSIKWGNACRIDLDRDYICDKCGEWICDIIPGTSKKINDNTLEFTPYETGIYVFTSNSSSDTYGYLYDADMNEITHDDDSGSGSNFLIRYVLEAGKTYYFGAEFYSSYINVSLSFIPLITYTLSDDESFYILSDCESSYITGELTIPSTYNGKPVTSIGDSAFENCRSLTSVNIPNTVTNIGWHAFYGCSSLSSVTIPDSVTRIGIDAFYGTACYNNTANWENGVLYIGKYLIKAETSLSGAYTVKEGTKCIADYAFDDCTDFTSVTIPDSVTSIGGYAFYGCSSLSSVTIPDSITSIGYGVFSGCSGLTSLTIPGSVTSIGDSAFVGCSGLTSVTIGNGVTSIGDYAFYNCSSLTSVTIPDSVTSIGDWAFYGCNNLTIYGLPGGYAEEYAKSHGLAFACAHFNFWSSKLDSPTCTTPGYREGYCLDCSEYVAGELSALGHDRSGAWVVEKAATCTTAGEEALYCKRCSEKIETKTITSLGHTYGEWITDTKPGCETAGAKHRMCSVCKATQNATIYALGHDYLREWTVDVKPGCETRGSKSHHCSRCESKADVSYIDPVGHTYGEWITDIKPGCETAGTKHRICTACKATQNDIIPATGHNYVRLIIEDTHPHYEILKCTLCGETKTGETGYLPDCFECVFVFENIDESSCNVTGYVGENSKVYIPAKVNTKTVEGIATAALKANTDITSVVIEDGVSEIGSLAFLNCSNLKKAVIPASVTTIGDIPFYGCASDFTLYCFSGSYAQQYAEANSINYVIIDIAETADSRIDYENKLVYTELTGTNDITRLLLFPQTTAVTPVGNANKCLGTGTVISVSENGGEATEYTVIVNGDLDGDGVCDVLDAALAERAASGHTNLSDAQAYAANNSADTEIDAESYQNVVNRALGA